MSCRIGSSSRTTWKGKINLNGRTKEIQPIRNREKMRIDSDVARKSKCFRVKNTLAHAKTRIPT